MAQRRKSAAIAPPGPNGKSKMGRPLGAVTRISRNAADDYVAAGGLLPLTVMGDNLEFYHKQGAQLVNKLMLFVEELRGETLTPACIAEVAKLINATNRVRVLSQQVAVDMAPFIHARLAAITVRNESDKPFTIEYANLEGIV